MIFEDIKTRQGLKDADPLLPPINNGVANDEPPMQSSDKVSHLFL